jgi:glycosyltransferase involved in cell wall biosynthesis
MIIYAIVVTYNASKWIDKCFGSLVNSSIPLKILAIDNGSVDETPNTGIKYRKAA